MPAKKPLPAPLMQFRVYPEPRQKRKLSVLVSIYRTKSQLIRAEQDHTGKRKAARLGGCCLLAASAADTGDVAHVCLHARAIWDVMVVHEFGHAALEWAKVAKLNQHKIWMNLEPDVERFVEGHAQMVKQFWQVLHNRHYYGESWFDVRVRK